MTTLNDLKDVLGDELDDILDSVLSDDDAVIVTPVCNPEPAVAEVTAEIDSERIKEVIKILDEAPVPGYLPQVVFSSDEIAEAIDLRQFATLVTLNTAQWHAKIKDRKAAMEAAVAAGANSETYNVTKNLLAGADEKLDKVHKIMGKARTSHYAMTLPWSTVSMDDAGKRRGGRMLPNVRFAEYIEQMATYKAQMETALDVLVEAYPTLVEIAEKSQGSAFNISDYPNTDSIRGHFDLSFDFHPVPMGGDFTGLADAQVEKLADTLNKKNNTMLENAMQELWQRLYKTVSHAYARLSDKDSSFHYTMMDRLKATAQDLEQLNVTGDKRLTQFAERIRKGLTMHDVKDIRKDDALRRHLAAEAKKILDDLNALGE